jgi:hypothetical protein
MGINLEGYVFTTRFVLKDQSPIVYVIHDTDGDWQFLGREDDLTEDDALLVSLGEILEFDPTIVSVLNLAEGEEAIRNDLNEKWERRSVIL